jgi:hypothetical protein
MAGKEYYEGKEMESNVVLHTHLIEFLNFDNIEVRGENSTKGDVVGITSDGETPISIKHGSQKNTQVHLPTLRSFAKAMNTPDNVTKMLEQWLGVTDQTQFESWFTGKQPTKLQQKYKRLFAEDIPGWENVVKWFNENRKTLAELLIQAMNGEKPAKYLVWVNKKKKSYQVIDIQTLVDWIDSDCVWITGPRNGGSTLRCEHNGKPIFHLQMKGSGGVGDEYNHNPQFHIHTYWPEKAIIHQGLLGA